MIKVCLKNEYFLLLLFHWIQTQMLDSKEEVFIKSLRLFPWTQWEKVKHKDGVTI